MNTEVYNYINEKQEEELNRRKTLILEVFHKANVEKNEELPPFVKYEEFKENFIQEPGTFVRNYEGLACKYSFSTSLSKEEVDALFELLVDEGNITTEEKTYNVTNGWLTFIGALQLIGLIIGIFFGLQYFFG